MTDFTIHTSDTTVIDADFATNPPSELNNITRGDTATFEFNNMITRLTVKSGDTYTVSAAETEQIDFVEVFGTLTIDGALQADTLTVSSSGTVNVNGTLDVNEQYALELEDVQRYERYAGKYNISETLSSQQKYTEFLPDTATADTLAIGIEPDSDLQENDFVGVWGLINSITDNRNQALSNQKVQINVDILAPYDDYTDLTALKSELRL